MNALTKLFKRGSKVEQTTTTERTEQDLVAQLRDLNLAIASTPADLFELQEERDRVQRQIEAARLVQQKRESDANRAAQKAQRDEFLARLYATMTTINGRIVNLKLELADLQKLIDEMNNVPFDGGGLVEDYLGVPIGFAAEVSAAIAAAAPNTQWDWGAVENSVLPVVPGRPRLTTQKTNIRMRFQGDMARPPFNANTGPWPDQKPIDGEGTSAMFLPLAK